MPDSANVGCQHSVLLRNLSNENLPTSRTGSGSEQIPAQILDLTNSQNTTGWRALDRAKM
jgi:hypothetical protein